MGRRRRHVRCSRPRCLASLLLSCMLTGAAAAEEAREVSIWGIGQISCGRFVQERERPAGPYGAYDATFRQWLLGFITALNWSDPQRRDRLAGTDAEGAMLWVENHCRTQPLDTFFDAALALERELSRKGR